MKKEQKQEGQMFVQQSQIPKEGERGVTSVTTNMIGTLCIGQTNVIA
jgi:hypothetical protein